MIHFVSTLANRLAEKRNSNYSLVMNWIRTKLSFALLISRILCVSGSRTLWMKTLKMDTVHIELSDSAATIKE